MTIKTRGRARTPIYEAWEQIVFPSDPKDRLSPAGETTWRLLWNTHIEEDLEGTSIDDVTLLCSLGWNFAVRERDWEAAVYRASRCVLHPDWPHADRPSRYTLLNNIAVGHLQMGHLNTALAQFSDLLEMRRPRDPIPHLLVRNSLYAYSQERPREELAPSELVALAAECLLGFKGCIRAAKALTPERCAFAELTQALERSYPK